MILKLYNMKKNWSFSELSIIRTHNVAKSLPAPSDEPIIIPAFVTLTQSHCLPAAEVRPRYKPF
jgi:hypothetical protein